MSITLSTDLLAINPAYNESIIEYSSTLTGVTYSEITIGTSVFKVYPIANKFNFNFKEIVKVLINQNNFSDSIVPNIATSFIYDDSTLSYSLTALIKVYNNITNESTTKTYKFIKSVEQLIGYKAKSTNVNSIRILLPTTNYTDYSIPYFEGYPMEFSIFGLTSGNTYYFKNKTTVNQSNTYTATTSNVKRIFFSDGGYNETTSNLLSLSTTSNLVELWVNGAFKSNINIKRIESNCGIYLKWFNQNGGYSYWLFDKFYTDTTSTKTIDEINGKYDNLQNVNSFSIITGKEGNSTYKITTPFNVLYKEYLTSILTSPSIEMYVHQSPFNQIDVNKFIAVKLSDGSFSFNNKNSNYKLELTITLPEILTQSI